MRFLSVCILLSLLSISSVSGFWVFNSAPLVVERLDSVITPGEISPHMHTVHGGSNFDKSYSQDDLMKSDCTTIPMSRDFSNYWAPTLYYVSPDRKTFTAIDSWARLYYLQRPGPLNQPIKAFPKNWKMMFGDPLRRTFSGLKNESAVTFVCLDYYNSHSGDKEWDERNDFFHHNCPNGMRAQFFFPSCWNGVESDVWDPKSVSYPIQNFQGGDCPSTHPIHFISLFFEFVFNVQDHPYNTGPGEITWILSNGDTTGYGFHGDFTNGWDIDLLQKAIDDPSCGETAAGDPSKCKPFQPYLLDGAYCKPSRPVVDENAGLTVPLTSLPGCNPIWEGTGPKPTCDKMPPLPGYRLPREPLPPNWSQIGCYNEAPSGNALAGPSWKDSTGSMTNAACARFCESKQQPFAATEYGKECYCGWGIANGAASQPAIHPSQCQVSCSGNDYETCGGRGTIQIMKNPTIKKSTIPDGWYEAGCYSEVSNGMALPDAGKMTNKNMTVTMCINYCSSQTLNKKGVFTYAGLEYSTECYCSNKISTAMIDISLCAMPCGGDLTRSCGDGSKLSVYKTGTPPADAPTLQGPIPPAANNTYQEHVYPNTTYTGSDQGGPSSSGLNGGTTGGGNLDSSASSQTISLFAVVLIIASMLL